jgi:ribonuclease BN (tRNA processing enzyme)
MINGITVKVLGDYGPFSRIGKSIGYLVCIGKSSYLVDCGAPIFQQLGGHGLKAINGLIITHCHDDHKRWFSDHALFNMYAADVSKMVFLLTTEWINTELIKSSRSALEISLSPDSKRIVDIPYESYISHKTIGPHPKYKIVSVNKGNGILCLQIVDRDGKAIGPDRAKIVINKKTGRPRMLFKDPDYGEWIEPESFYPFSSEVFYEKDKNVYKDPEGFTIEAVKDHVWHGLSGIGVRFKTENESLLFSSDTVHDKELWRQLYSEKRTTRIPLTQKEFVEASFIYGDINDYIERTWSEERFHDAAASFNDSVVIHDIAIRDSIVHTDYRRLHNTVLQKDKTILTHSPDRMTSEWVLSDAGKSFRIKGGDFFELVGEKLYPLDADIYHKEAGKYYVGYKSAQGKTTLYENDGALHLSQGEKSGAGSPLYQVDLYECIAGKYFPVLEDKKSVYWERPDGEIELVELCKEGSRGKVIDNYRDCLSDLQPKPASSAGFQPAGSLY